MAKNYDTIKAKFVQYLANPIKEKDQGEWSEENGVHETTLSDWKGQPWFREALVKEVEKYLGDDLGEIYDAIKKKAKKGDISAATLYLKQAELLKADKTEWEGKLNVDFLKPLIDETRKEVDEERQKQIEEAKRD